eukprot:9449165-Pyramimonas_sp.AAC.1
MSPVCMILRFGALPTTSREPRVLALLGYDQSKHDKSGLHHRRSAMRVEERVTPAGALLVPSLASRSQASSPRRHTWGSRRSSMSAPSWMLLRKVPR